MTRTVSIPGFVSVHSHSLARRPSAGTETAGSGALEVVLQRAYRRMRAAGITAVGEAAWDAADAGCAAAAAAAAEAAGILLVWLHPVSRERHGSVAAYLREVDAIRTTGVVVAYAVPSPADCPPGWLEEIGRAAARDGSTMHVVAHERARDATDCRTAHGSRPMELLARAGCLGPNVVLAHMTHADGPDLDHVAAHGAAVCTCPSGDAHLGNGFLPVNRLLHRQIPLCIGTDVAAVVDPLAELRELEWVARRQKGARTVLPADRLLEIGAGLGALALGLDAWPAVEIDLGHPALAGVPPEGVPTALVESCGADVVVGASA